MIFSFLMVLIGTIGLVCLLITRKNHFQYKILSADSNYKLATLVEELLDEGYKLAGGMQVANGVFYQAVVKNYKY